MKVLDLFSVTCSALNVFKEYGHEVLTVENDLDFTADMQVDILNIDIRALLEFNPDVIWASPPCTAFSVASIGTHWKYGNISDKAILGTRLLCKTIEIIMLCRPKYWFIENPRGMMRKLPIMDMVNKNTITYCQYGDTRMKPTDIWTNCEIWKSKPMCKNGDSCHVSAPRGSRTGTQGLKNATERSMIPRGLIMEIIESIV